MNSKKTAIALYYPCDAEAPFILANTKGLLAEKLIKIAREKNIPTKEDKFLADILSVCDIGTCVPEESYEALAKIFGFIIQNEKKWEKINGSNKKANW